jgi:beta-N-acetylhexosaminidase
MSVSLSVLCGQLLVVGLAGTEFGAEERRAFASGERGGVTLFRRNVAAVDQVAELTRALREACPAELPPLVAIDQEGGRVVRIGSPALALPAMRRIGDLGDEAFAARLAEAQAVELRALGITMSFAPVADVHTRADNPIIGDRAFGTTPDTVARFAGAWADGLARGGLLTCAKHFPGHGDTTVDSHLALPKVDRPKDDLLATEVAPFRALARRASISAMMTAHVVYPALDAERPATLSRAICTDLLRRELGFEGVLFSDDLEMKAIAAPVGEAAVAAVAAGCDVLLVCSRADLAAEAHAALVREAESSAPFRARCEEAYGRALAMRRRVPGASGTFTRHDELASELSRRLEGRLG